MADAGAEVSILRSHTLCSASFCESSMVVSAIKGASHPSARFGGWQQMLDKKKMRTMRKERDGGLIDCVGRGSCLPSSFPPHPSAAAFSLASPFNSSQFSLPPLRRCPPEHRRWVFNLHQLQACSNVAASVKRNRTGKILRLHFKTFLRLIGLAVPKPTPR